ncbi:MAG: hypothetical protein JWN66_4417 [Sphingomonas bacterium]|uniref:TonB-dependent receptor n=1 Tax=Sphingomonas bacterium TaxID=1895847 RepID=UPI00260A5537|nr:TonB-dependent receptor [Sphingomonas bacterium]MDB5707301.1 hypothetical protein [Sphingomonas bacterium]
MNVSKIFRLGLLSGVAGAALAAAPTSAQTSGSAGTSPAAAGAQSDDPVMDDVVVTAQFRKQNVQDTPLAITAIDASVLAARGQSSVIDIAAQAPNVTLRPATATFGPSIQAFIRGVGQYDSSYAFEPGVGLYVDDVYYPSLTGSIVDLVDLDRVEILRGPQGTLSGQNSIGGSIKIYSKKPDGEGGGFVQATYGRFNRVEARGALDVALVPDKLFARITATGVSRDGYVTRYDYACTHPGTTVPSFQTANADCKLGTQGGKSYAAVRGALRWVASDRLEVNLIGDYTNDTSEAAPSTLLFVGNQAGVPGVPNATSAYQIGGVALGNATGSPFITYSPYGNFAQDSFTSSPYVNYATYVNPAPRDGTAAYTVGDRNAISGWGISGQVDFELTDTLSLKSITAYRSYVTRYVFDEGSPVDTALIDNYDRLKQVSQELRLTGKIADTVNFTIGGFFFRYDAVTRQRVDIPSLQFIEDDKIRETTKAAFANVDWEIATGLNLVGGIRYTTANKTVTYGRRGTPGSIFGGLPDPRVRSLDGVVGRHESDNWDFRGALQYRWSPEIMTYAQVSTGFKIGGVNPRAFFPQQALPFGPEKLTAYELGVKTDLFDRHVRLNLSGFYNKYRDILVVVSSCPLTGAPAAPCALPVNAGEATVQGIEAETTLRLAPGLTADASVAYLDFDYTSLSAAAIASGVTLSMRGPFTPKWQYSGGLQYDADLGSAGHLIPRLDLAHVDAFYQQASNAALNRVPGRTLLNAHLTWLTQSKDWSVTLEVSNLTNKLYYNSVFDNRGSNSTVTGYPGAPREWAVTVKRSF